MQETYDKEIDEIIDRISSKVADQLSDEMVEKISDLFEDDDEKTTVRITVICETWWQSFINDLTTVTLLAGLIVVNELTIKSAVLNFMFGVMGFILAGMHLFKLYKKDSIRGTDTEKLIEKLRNRLNEINPKI